MAITTLDGVIAGAQPPVYFTKLWPATQRMVSMWPLTGIPAAGVYPNGTPSGGTYSSTGGYVPGSIPHTDPAGGLNSYLSRLSVHFAGGTLPAGTACFLADRLWDNGGITITSNVAQTISSVVWPNRDAVGGNTGVGVLIGVEVSAATGAGTPTLTVNYTNTANSSGRIGTNTTTTIATSPAGLFYVIGLQGSDVGVQSVQQFTLSATWTSGTINLVAFRILSTAWTSASATPLATGVDCITGGFPRLYNGVVPFILVLTGASSTGGLVNGSYVETQG